VNAARVAPGLEIRRFNPARPRMIPWMQRGTCSTHYPAVATATVRATLLVLKRQTLEVTRAIQAGARIVFERDRAATPLEAAQIRSRDCDAGDVQRCSFSAFAEAWRSPTDRHVKLLPVRPLHDVSERGLGCDLADG
jgi:hypothetical protein